MQWTETLASAVQSLEPRFMKMPYNMSRRDSRKMSATQWTGIIRGLGKTVAVEEEIISGNKLSKQNSN